MSCEGEEREERGKGISIVKFIFSSFKLRQLLFVLVILLSIQSRVSTETYLYKRHQGESSTRVYVYVHTRRSVKPCVMSRLHRIR